MRASGEVENPECPTGGATYTEYFLFSAPSPRYCGGLYPYPGYTLAGDTLWGDEEWNFDLPPLDSTYSDSAGDIEWPELEELRRRIRMGDSLTGPGQRSLDSIGAGAVAESPIPAEVEEPAEAGGVVEPEPDLEEVERDPPRVLGEPVVRDGGP